MINKLRFQSARPQINLENTRIPFDSPFTHDLFGNKIIADADITTTNEEINNNDTPKISYEYEETDEEIYQENPLQEETRVKKVINGFRGLQLPLEYKNPVFDNNKAATELSQNTYQNGDSG